MTDKTNAQPKKESTLLRHDYSDRERSDLGQALASAVAELVRLDSERKSIQTDYKSRMQEQEAKIKSLSSRVQSGFEMRPTVCIVRIDRESLLKRFWTLDQDPDVDEAVKDETLPAGYQLNIDDNISTGEGADVVVDEGDLLAPLDEEGTNGDESRSIEKVRELLTQDFDIDEEPDARKDRQVWLVWVQWLIMLTRKLYLDVKPDEVPADNKNLVAEVFTVPPVEHLDELNKPALNRIRNWARTHIKAADNPSNEKKLPGLPVSLEEWYFDLWQHAKEEAEQTAEK